MRFVSQTLFLVPLSVHLGYLAATYPGIAAMVGRTADDAGTPKAHFTWFWCLTIALANLTFIALYLYLPRMKDPMLKVPSASYWLSTAKRRRELVSRLRGIVEAALLGLNVFFLAVYQSIYQANALTPVLRFAPAILITLFMAAPILLVFAAGILIIRAIALDAGTPDG